MLALADLATEPLSESLDAKLGEAVRGPTASQLVAGPLQPASLAAIILVTLSLSLPQVTQQEIFNAHARRYEAEFLEDLAALNIRLPDSLTRVTDYVPDIVAYVE